MSSLTARSYVRVFMLNKLWKIHPSFALVGIMGGTVIALWLLPEWYVVLPGAFVGLVAGASASQEAAK